MRIPLLLFFGAILLLSYQITKPFIGHHDFNNAFYANMARNLVRYGPLTTKLGQVTNIGPATPSQFTFHTHHPPLMIWLLAISYSVFKVTEFATRLVPIVFSALTVAVLFSLLKRVFNLRIAIVSCVFWITTPIFSYFGKMAIHEVLVLFFFVVSLLCYYRNWSRGLIVSCVLWCLSGWPAFYIPVVIIFIDVLSKKALFNRRLLWLLVIPVVIFLILLGHNYVLTGDAFGGGLINALFFRTASVPIGDYVRKELGWLMAYYSKPLMVGTVLGIMMVIFSKDRKHMAFFLGILIYAAMYLIVFRSSAYRHDYLIYYFLPFVTVAAGYFVSRLNKLLIIVCFLAPVLFSFQFTKALLESDYMREGLSAGKLIEITVGKNESVIVSNTDILTNADWTTAFYGDRKMEIVRTEEKGGQADWRLLRGGDCKLVMLRSPQ